MMTLPAVLNFPDISPTLFEINLGPIHIALRWYALAYIFGIILGWSLISYTLKRAELWPNNQAPMRKELFEDLVTWIIIGVIVGGRLGYVLFYQPAQYLADPIEIIRVWNGGMAFHGGFLGVVIAAFIWGKRNDVPLLPLADSLALAAPIGLLFGRLANFINAELWGKPWDGPWAVIFPFSDAQSCTNVGDYCARHPSQLYEAGLEGLLLGGILLTLAFGFKALKRSGLITGLFLMGYGVSRFIVEFYREADQQFISIDNPAGHVFFFMQMGQILSLPLIFSGLYLIFMSRKHRA